MRIKACTPFTTLLRLCVPTIPAVVVDCCVFVLHCWQYIPSLSLSSLSLSFGVPLPVRSWPCHCIYLPTWWFTLSFGWWVDYPTLQRFRDIYHYILLLVLRPAGDIGGRGIVLSALQSVILKCRIITLTNLRTVSRLLSILHPTPLTAYYLLLVGSRQLIS